MSKVINWTKRNTDLSLTIICGILIAIGFIFAANAMHLLSNITFAAAIMIGGFESAKEGITKFRQARRLDSNILMIIAAIGACIIDHFSEGAILIFIFSLAHSLEHYTESKSRDAISELMKMVPETARKYTEDGSTVVVETKTLEIGDRIQIPKGETVPIDGELSVAEAYLNEASITGEPMPVWKKRSDSIIGGSLNEGESFDMTVTVTDENTLMSKILNMVDEAQNNPSSKESLINRIEGVFVKSVLIFVPIFILVSPYLLSWSWQNAFYRGMIMLTVASPCALVASASPAKLSAISRGAKQGMILRGGDVIDTTATVDTVVFDKTGTLTLGIPRVTLAYYHSSDEEELINQIVKSAEATSTHPIAKAFMTQLEDTSLLELDQIENITGKGFRVNHKNQIWKIGNRSLIEFEKNNYSFTEKEQKRITESEKEGSTIVFVTCNDEFKAFFGITDPIKTESINAINSLHQEGVETIILTGDAEKNSKYIAEKLGVNKVRANLLPGDKLKIVEELQAEGRTVLMVGDGVNDAPALAVADVGIAMGSGTDVAMETADIILVKNNLCRVPFILGMAKKTNQIIKQNIIFSLGVILLLITANIMQFMNLPLGVLGHEGSTILVILNGLRMLTYGRNKDSEELSCETQAKANKQLLEKQISKNDQEGRKFTDKECEGQSPDCLVQYGYSPEVYCQYCDKNPDK